MASEKNLHHFCFWHPPLFNFFIVILLPGTKEIFLPDGLKKILLQLASPLTIFPCTGRDVLLNLQLLSITALFYNNFLINQMYHYT